MAANTVSGMIAIVTGASHGLGAEIARLLVENNAEHVAIFDICADKGRKLEKEINGKHGNGKIIFIMCDVSNEQELASAYNQVIEAYKRIDVVFNNAGIFDEIRFKEMVDVNVVGVIGSTLKAIELMRFDQGGKGGSIVNVASISAFFNSNVCALYGATKSAILYFSSNIGLEANYTRTKVRVVTVCPGMIDTSMVKVDLFKTWDANNARAQMQEIIKGNEYQSPMEAARAILKAWQEGKSGSTWIVDGGHARDVTDVFRKSKEPLFNLCSIKI